MTGKTHGYWRNRDIVKINYGKKDKYLPGHRRYKVYTRKFIIGVFLLVGIPVHLHKQIKTRQWKSYLNILDFLLLARPLYLLIAKYLTAKAERQEKAYVLFAQQLVRDLRRP